MSLSRSFRKSVRLYAHNTALFISIHTDKVLLQKHVQVRSDLVSLDFSPGFTPLHSVVIEPLLHVIHLRITNFGHLFVHNNHL